MPTHRSTHWVVGLPEVDAARVAIVGGKAANVAALSRIEGIRVPHGFVVTTDAFERALARVPALDDRLDGLSLATLDDTDAVRQLSAELRDAVAAVGVPADVAAAITEAVAVLGPHAACAVRSSATVEDSPTASFAGLHDTFLNVVGQEIVECVGRCWASLFTERAVAYRLRHGLDHRAARMAVLVQRMVVPDAAGVVFTADPLTSNRKVSVVEATFGLGEALVSGVVTPDVFSVRDDHIVAATVATKPVVIVPAPGGGTRQEPVAPERRSRPALTDAQVVGLAQLGRRIEAHAGCPQDVEWCTVGDDVFVVQSRPITTLFPVPAAGDGGYHVYVSVGHQQMMTDPMTPLGLSMWRLTAARPMVEAGGRLFVDVTAELASPTIGANLVQLLGRSDPLIGDALSTIVERGDIPPTQPGQEPARPPAGGQAATIATDPAVVADLIERTEASVARSARHVAAASGPEVFEVVLADIADLKRLLFDPRNLQVIVAAVQATWWLDDHLAEWLGEKSAASTLTLSAPGNVTAEMGLALLDVADVIRPHPEVVAFLRDARDDRFLEAMAALPGGQEACDAIGAFLERYGMRCVGEIDIARPRWAERPSTLVPVILGNVEHFAPGEARRRFEQGRELAQRKEEDVLRRLRALPDGDAKADETKRVIDRLRTFVGYREHPKYGMVSRYFVYKRALLREAERLVRAGVLDDREDAFLLTFDELHEAVRTGQVDRQLVDRRRADLAFYATLTPPRVLTSEGEIVAGSYRRGAVPAGVLVGLPVSSGIVEGRARVVGDLGEARLEPGDILVTTATDPSWTPLFVTAGALVTEVGGLTTHGAVIAREYGLPAVVGVENATRLIPDGARVRVDGTHGSVEVLSGDAPAPRHRPVARRR